MKRFALLLGMLAAVGVASAIAEEPAAETKPKAWPSKSQGAIVEVNVEKRVVVIEWSKAKTEYKVAEDASIKTADKETATLEDLKPGERYNFWFVAAEDGTRTINRMTPKGAPKPAEPAPVPPEKPQE